jgi:hypothetical protein
MPKRGRDVWSLEFGELGEEGDHDGEFLQIWPVVFDKLDKPHCACATFDRAGPGGSCGLVSEDAAGLDCVGTSGRACPICDSENRVGNVASSGDA